MGHSWSENNLNRDVAYSWRVKGIGQNISILAGSEPLKIAEGSEAHFITEHYWGYAKIGLKRTNEYEVKHPEWMHYKVEDYKVNVDFALNYGESFRFLNDTVPLSVILVEGSEIL